MITLSNLFNFKLSIDLFTSNRIIVCIIGV